ncbi:MAG: 2-C-methyl-D-erythritol 4-phosphate cytidylyltransferase [bacterium]|nr:2-C-methyl-D-erythritol 4-phosphate cytidylyltransferase [bacterium]
MSSSSEFESSNSDTVSEREHRVAAVLVAAGRSTRMNAAGGPRKPFLQLGERTVIEHTCAAFASVDEIVIVAQEDDLERMAELTGAKCVAGGAERTDSVQAGVRAVSDACDVVLVHDAARPLVRAVDVQRVAALAAEHGAALLAIRARDTIKASPDGKEAVSTLDRAILWAAQTPQGFRVAKLREVLAEADRDGYRPTDDAALWERYVGPVLIVPGDAHNLKLTTPEDLLIAEAILRARESE